MESYPILFQVETGDDERPAILTKRAELPFLPRKGDWVSPQDYDDMREVDGLYWTPSAGYSVWFVNEDRSPAQVEAMKSAGWVEEEA